MQNNYFLHIVAESLVSRFGSNLPNVVVVSPNIKTKFFLNQYLYRLVQKPLWSPQYKTIESLFQESSSLKIGEEIQLIFELHSAYSKVYKRTNSVPFKETIDKFFFFGKILLKDFDEIDKNRINASLLYCNLQNQNAIRNIFSCFSDSQIQTLTCYFKKTFFEKTPLQTNFQNIWSLLREVYICFKEQLQKKKIAYPGMLMRQAVEQNEIFSSNKHYAFVGFNFLNKCEEFLFTRLKEKSSFYWDYDCYYLDTEAGRFIKKNINLFGSVFKKEKFNNFLFMNRKINLVDSPSLSGQSAIIPKWIEDFFQKANSSLSLQESAIVLCNETILPIVVNAISSKKIEKINITTGFPILQTGIGSFMILWAEMQIKGYRSSDKSLRSTYVLPILRHHFGRLLIPNAEEIEKKILQENIFFLTLSDLQNQKIFATTPDTPNLIHSLSLIIKKINQLQENNTEKKERGLNQESIFQACIVLDRLHFLLSSEYSNLEKPIFLRLFKKYLSRVRIPFENEPLQGLQIMNVLATHTLDFKHILLLNTNEGNMPTNSNKNTFIPSLLRKHFGINAQERRDSIYAYYFYRLISRAENVTLVYTTHETPVGKTEMSRFLLQLLTDIRLKNRIKRFTLQPSNIQINFSPIQIKKEVPLMQKIKEKYDLKTNLKIQSLSPSSLKLLIECSYRFYLEYIQEFKKNSHSMLKTDQSILGLLFHRSAELLYREIGIGKLISSDTLKKYIYSPQKVRMIVLKALQKEIFKGRVVTEKDYTGEQLINIHVLCKILTRLLKFDLSQTPFTILGLELALNSSITTTGGENEIQIKGIIDRIQKEKDGKHRIIDYKTGLEKIPSKDPSKWLNPENHSVFQILIYAILYAKEKKQIPIVPTLLYVQQPNQNVYSLTIDGNEKSMQSFKDWEKTLIDELSKEIEKLFNPTIPFLQTENHYSCRLCPFKELCNR